MLSFADQSRAVELERLAHSARNLVNELSRAKMDGAHMTPETYFDMEAIYNVTRGFLGADLREAAE